MNKTKEKILSWLYAFITIFIWIIVSIFAFSYFLKDIKTLPECIKTDIYDIWDFEKCESDGFQIRTVEEIKENITCKNPWKIERPDEKRACEYIPICIESDWKKSEWSICVDEKQTRQIEKKSKCENGFTPEKEQSCIQKISYLFKNDKKTHTTIIDNNNCINGQCEYSKDGFNHNNLEIIPSGKFNSIYLHIIADTSYKIPEYYYIFFDIDKKYAIPRALGTSRIFIDNARSKLDTKDYWLFQWTDTPKKLKFNLNETKVAKESKVGAWFDIKDYVKYINNYSEKNLKMTLFLADGRSMTTSENSKRIYGTITDAWFEYECEEKSNCSILRVPEIK